MEKLKDIKNEYNDLHKAKREIESKIEALEQKMDSAKYEKVVNCGLLKEVKWKIRYGITGSWDSLRLEPDVNRMEEMSQYTGEFFEITSGMYHSSYKLGEYVDIQICDGEVSLSIQVFEVKHSEKKQKIIDVLNEYGIKITDTEQRDNLNKAKKTLVEEKLLLEDTQEFIDELNN